MNWRPACAGRQKPNPSSEERAGQALTHTSRAKVRLFARTQERRGRNATSHSGYGDAMSISCQRTSTTHAPRPRSAILNPVTLFGKTVGAELSNCLASLSRTRTPCVGSVNATGRETREASRLPAFYSRPPCVAPGRARRELPTKLRLGRGACSVLFAPGMRRVASRRRSMRQIGGSRFEAAVTLVPRGGLGIRVATAAIGHAKAASKTCWNASGAPSSAAARACRASRTGLSHRPHGLCHHPESAFRLVQL